MNEVKNTHTRRTEVVRVRLSPTEHEAVRTLAAAEQRSLSETLREMVRQQIERRGLWAATFGKDADA